MPTQAQRFGAFLQSKYHETKLENLYGFHCIKAALYANRRKFRNLFFSNSQANILLTKNQDMKEIIDMANDLNVPFKFVPKETLDKYSSDRPHQGMILVTENLKTKEVKKLSSVEKSKNGTYRYHVQAFEKEDCVTLEEPRLPFWVALNDIKDPQNLGAIIRSSFLLGASGIMVSLESAAATEVFEHIYYTRTLSKILADARSSQWRVIGTHLTSGATSLESMQEITQPSILVMGSEESGLSQDVMQTIDDNVTISCHEERHKLGFVDSLNVSVATGILLHSLLNKRKKE